MAVTAATMSIQIHDPDEAPGFSRDALALAQPHGGRSPSEGGPAGSRVQIEQA